MTRQPVLVLISEDPCASHRANEAMRIALGVVAGENEVSIVLAGARVVGIAGGPDKCRAVVDDFGFDACIDYRTANMKAALKEHCPRGVDVYLYLIDDAVTAVEDARVQALAARGLKLFVCAYGCQKRRQPLSDLATNCGLVVLTDIINGTDRFLSLN